MGGIPGQFVILLQRAVGTAGWLGLYARQPEKNQKRRKPDRAEWGENHRARIGQGNAASQETIGGSPRAGPRMVSQAVRFMRAFSCADFSEIIFTAFSIRAFLASGRF